MRPGRGAGCAPAADDLVADVRVLRRRLTVDEEVLACGPEADPDAPAALLRERSWLGRLFGTDA